MTSNKLFDLLEPQEEVGTSPQGGKFFTMFPNNDQKFGQSQSNDSVLSLYSSSLGITLQSLQQQFYPKISLEIIDNAVIACKGDLNAAKSHLYKYNRAKNDIPNSKDQQKAEKDIHTSRVSGNLFRVSWPNRGKGIQLEDEIVTTSTPKTKTNSPTLIKETKPRVNTSAGDVRNIGGNFMSKFIPQKSDVEIGNTEPLHNKSNNSIGKLVSRKFSDTFGRYSQFKNGPEETHIALAPSAQAAPVLPVLPVSPVPPNAIFADAPLNSSAEKTQHGETEDSENISSPITLEDGGNAVDFASSEFIADFKEDENSGTAWDNFN